MPATAAELTRWVEMTLDDEVMPDSVLMWADGTRPIEAEWNLISELWHCRMYQRICSQRRPARRKANRLLRQFLTPQQRQQLRSRHCFDVLAPSGTRYRFWPRFQRVAELELHGGRYYERASFCLHPDNATELPSADVTLSQLLLISADEAEFLEKANRTELSLWDGDWRRRLNRARAIRQADEP